MNYHMDDYPVYILKDYWSMNKKRQKKRKMGLKKFKKDWNNMLKQFKLVMIAFNVYVPAPEYR